MLGGSKFRLRQGFAAQNAWDAGLPAGMDSCGANLLPLFFTFPKRTVGQIDKCTGFWYNECEKRRICRCTLPMQVLLLMFSPSYMASSWRCTLPMQVLLLLFRLCFVYLPQVAPYLCRYYYSWSSMIKVSTAAVAPYLCRYYYSTCARTKFLNRSGCTLPMQVLLLEQPYHLAIVVCGCTLPIQVLLLVSPFSISNFPRCTLPMQVLLLFLLVFRIYK